MHDRFRKPTPPRAAPAASAALLALGLSLALPMSSQAAEALRVVRDPVTGELRGPTAAEAAAFKKAEEALRQQQQLKAGATAVPAPVTREIQHPDGSVEMQLGEDSHLYSVVRAKEDGSLDMQCLPGQQAKSFVKGASKASAAKPAAKVSAAKAQQRRDGHEGHNHE